MGLMMKILPIFLFTLFLLGCGTTSSLENNNLVPYAKVDVSDSLTVTGRLLNDTDSSLTVAVNGVSIEYHKSYIKGYEKIMLPDESLMSENIVRNTSKTASNLAYFVILSIVSLIGVLISIWSNIDSPFIGQLFNLPDFDGDLVKQK